jgi:2-C-methyl-D-erythritol 2,4-cyclodiphosphate synthase
LRIGHGFDVHAFGPGDRVFIGGVEIAWERGVVAHSDGVVALHALCDALLGAAALGDIGKHFPDTSDEFENIDSRILLRGVKRRLVDANYRLVNADITVVAQLPRLGPHIGEMRENLAADLAVSATCISIKATTTEGMGYTGRGEGIATHAVALLESVT